MPAAVSLHRASRGALVLLASLALAGPLACGDDGSSGGPADQGSDEGVDTTPDGTSDTDADADTAPDLEPDLGCDPDATPGTWEEGGRPEMNAVTPAHDAAAPTEDEIVIYYYREDGDYDPWGVWLWAYPGGDGADHWDYTQDFEVVDGVGYLKFQRDGSDIGGVPAVGADNEFGFIIRQDAAWVKDGDEDRLWDADTSNEVVVFSGDQTNYQYGPYVPFFVEAKMLSATTIDVRLSGRHALQATPDDNGFIVRRADDSESYTVTDVQNADALGDRCANYTDHLLVTLAEPVDIGPALVIEHPDYLEPFPININDLLVELAESAVPDASTALGAVYDPEAGEVEFRVWSPVSSAVVARLYDSSGAETPAHEVTLTLDEATGVWSGTYSDEDPGGMFYDYLVTNRNGTNACLDPYALSMDAYDGSGGAGRGAIVDLDAAEATPDGWDSDGYATLAQREDAIIYEIHVRDFTISPDSGVTGTPGTYEAFIEKLPYLEDLGVTHIQLMPVLNFYYTDETDQAYEDSGTASGNNYNWGYDPHNYFTPEGWYSSDPTDPYARVLELRELIEAIHEAGMGVLLDVVYNHIATPPLLDNVVPAYYFRTNPDGSLTSSSGVGNDIATTRTMARRLIVDSTRFWVDQYHIDGFRFDLMGLIDSDTMEEAYAASAAVNPDVLFEGEGWKLYNGPAGTVGLTQDYMTQTNDISVFNDEIRDLMKGGGLDDTRIGFLTNRVADTEAIFLNLIGEPQSNYTADDPGDSMAYLAAHDNLTLHDNIAHNTGLSDEDAAERQALIDRIEIGNFLILTGQSIAFLHGGQERGRTKPKLSSTTEIIGNYVSNSYDAADNINQFVWTLDAPAEELVAFTRGLIDLRRNTPAFRLGDQSAIDTATSQIALENGHALGYSLTSGGDTWFILANVDAEAVTFDVGVDVSGATVLVDGDEADKAGVSEVTGITIDGSEVTLEPLTPALLFLAGE